MVESVFKKKTNRLHALEKQTLGSPHGHEARLIHRITSPPNQHSVIFSIPSVSNVSPITSYFFFYYVEEKDLPAVTSFSPVRRNCPSCLTVHHLETNATHAASSLLSRFPDTRPRQIPTPLATTLTTLKSTPIQQRIRSRVLLLSQGKFIFLLALLHPLSYLLQHYSNSNICTVYYDHTPNDVCIKEKLFLLPRSKILDH